MGAALSPNYEYKYRYNGRLATGIPHTRSQVAGTGIEFDVIVSMTSASEAIVKVRNFFYIKFEFKIYKTCRYFEI